MILPIKNYPEKILSQKAKKVGKIDKEIEKLIDDMIETMYSANGAGLAANQVGVLKQILVFDDGNGIKVMINPKISGRHRGILGAEGCLSFPGLELAVKRPNKLTVKYLDRAGKSQQMKAEGLTARIICHETDHLVGKTIIDHLNLIKKLPLKKKYLERLKER